MEVYEHKELGRNHSPVYLPNSGPNEHGKLELSWGVVYFDSMYSWMNSVKIGWEFRRPITIIQLSRDGWPTRLMMARNAWPIEWQSSELNTDGSKWALQKLVVVYDSFNMVSIPIDMGSSFGLG
jgi:phage tail-like protein